MTVNSKEVALYLISLFERVYKSKFSASKDDYEDWEIYDETRDLMAYCMYDQWVVFPMNDVVNSVEIDLNDEEGILKIMKGDKSAS